MTFFGMTPGAEQTMAYCQEQAQSNPMYAVAYGLLQVAESIHRLGNAGGATEMGALEFHADAVANAIRSGLSEVAAALEAAKD